MGSFDLDARFWLAEWVEDLIVLWVADGSSDDRKLLMIDVVLAVCPSLQALK